jgi:hypothetical protein
MEQIQVKARTGSFRKEDPWRTVKRNCEINRMLTFVAK